MTNSTTASPASLSSGGREYVQDQKIMGIPFLKRKVVFSAFEKISHGRIVERIELEKTEQEISLSLAEFSLQQQK